MPEIGTNIFEGDAKARRDKRKRRIELLIKHPEKRIQIATPQLKEIIDYTDFKCAEDCSVAKGLAIKGSDIDAGIVVCKEKPASEQKAAFVKELRNQGFTVYTELEYELSMESIGSKKIDAHQVLRFYTETVAREFRKSGKYPSLSVKAILNDGAKIV